VFLENEMHNMLPLRTTGSCIGCFRIHEFPSCFPLPESAALGVLRWYVTDGTRSQSLSYACRAADPDTVMPWTRDTVAAAAFHPRHRLIAFASR
jgi:hypothetical protein